MSFNGVAIYDSGVFPNEIGEDVSPIVSLASPSVTRFLNEVGDGETSITNKVYSWEEKFLLPDTYSNSSAIASNAGTSQGLEIGANAEYLRVQDILQVRGSSEQVLVTSIGASAATIYVTRAYAGTTANSQAAGVDIDFLGSALEEGSSPRQERRRNKVLKSNFVQTFREEIVQSNLFVNTRFKSAGQPAPFEEEKVDKTKEVMKQLERAVLIGRTNGNTIGASDSETTMAGIYSSIATNVVSNATFSNSIINNMLQEVNNNTDLAGETQNYLLLAGTTAHRLISNSRASRVEDRPTDTAAGLAPAQDYLSDFGRIKLMENRWIPTGSVLALRKDFIKVKPFAGNSFQFRSYDTGASAQEGYVEGTYGLEFHQEQVHGKLDGLAS